jgi:hypothetical protein
MSSFGGGAGMGMGMCSAGITWHTDTVISIEWMKIGVEEEDETS